MAFNKLGSEVFVFQAINGVNYGSKAEAAVGVYAEALSAKSGVPQVYINKLAQFPFHLHLLANAVTELERSATPDPRPLAEELRIAEDDMVRTIAEEQIKASQQVQQISGPLNPFESDKEPDFPSRPIFSKD